MEDSLACVKHASLMRRVACIFYDSLLLLSVLFLGTAIVLPLNDGDAIPPQNLLYIAYLLSLSFLYFGWFWTHGGQTLGMRAWKVRLQRRDKSKVRWRHVAIRFITALFSWAAAGIGFLWSIFDTERLAWHDRFSGTTLVVESSPKRP